ncbi:MAG TPA: class I adenylate-forming enzyme family protein [Ignavibacteria bacterium]|nr:class I adenylate-forming enzyme family protein [Ignavibacteria bacterium]
MILSENTTQNIHRAHYVNGIAPDKYLVKYRNIYELLQYRAHLQPEVNFITYYPDSGDKITLTYAELSEKVYKTANLLKAKGISPGDRISTISHNHINTVIQYFAAWCLGATVVPVNISEEPERIEYILKSSHTKLAFINGQYYDKFKEVLSRLSIQSILHSGFTVISEPGVSNFENELESQSADFTPDESVSQETESLIVYTSGTTGLPKGVVLTQYNLLADADGISKWHGITKGTVMMCVLPIHHVNGTVVTIMTPMYAGGSLILNQKFHTDNFFKRLADENVNIVSVVPTLLQFLCHDYESSERFRAYLNSLLSGEGTEVRLRAFRHIICGAGPLTCELVQKFENLFGLKIVHGYGLSETTCYSCFIPTELSDTDHKKWLLDHGFPSIGIAFEPNEMDIHNEHGESVPENTRGEIVIRGHNVMKYYDENAEANDKTFEFGWFRSGDEGFYLNDNAGRKYFFITGRLKELIIRGGVNIAPLEIDEVLMSIPEIKSAIAVGFDNDWYGEEVGALVLLKDNVTKSEETKRKIIDHCRTKLPAYKSPKVVLFSDTIPVTSTGKYQRNKVKHLFSDFKTIQHK